MSADDVAKLGRHVEMTKAALKERQQESDAFDAQQENDPAVQKMRADRDALWNASKEFPIGHPERGRLQNEMFDLPQPPENPFDDGDLLGETTAKIGGLHVSSRLTDTGSRRSSSPGTPSTDE
jgi:hypothetical protein